MDGLLGIYAYIYINHKEICIILTFFLFLFPFSWGHHLHYDIEFRGFSVSDSRSYAWRHKTEYCNFGVVAVALEIIPLFNLIFMWTNVVGAALYVGDKYEKNEREIAKRNRSSVSTEVIIPQHPGAKSGYGSFKV